MDSTRRSQDPLEVITRVRSAAILLAGDEAGGFAPPDGPLRATHVRMARAELELRGRAAFMAERWATQPVMARARVVWRGWAQSFTGSLRWEHGSNRDVTPRMRERLDELNTLLSGPATCGELRVLDSYESYFHVLFTLGWAIVARIEPMGDSGRLPDPAQRPQDIEAATAAWNEIRTSWIMPWQGRRRHNELVELLMKWIESTPAPPREIGPGAEPSVSR